VAVLQETRVCDDSGYLCQASCRPFITPTFKSWLCHFGELEFPSKLGQKQTDMPVSFHKSPKVPQKVDTIDCSPFADRETEAKRP
jgi:hypothetical protein